MNFCCSIPELNYKSINNCESIYFNSFYDCLLNSYFFYSNYNYYNLVYCDEVMACVNVNRSLSDQFYRYKMPKILAKVEGKGNGIKTVIVNMVDIAKSLNRPPMCNYTITFS